MNAEQLIADFRRMPDEKWGYIPGASGELWTAEKQEKKAAKDAQVAKYGAQWIGHHVADCSGAFVWAYRQHGLSIYHGSNRIAREYVQKLLPPAEAKPGMVAFKGRNPGDKYYDLPSEYKPGGSHYNGDLVDYYHIGLIDNNPAMVINAQSTKNGVNVSQLSNGWCAVGWPKGITKPEEGEKMNKKMIVVGSGYLNLRPEPSKGAASIGKLYPGDAVTVTQEFSDGWAFVSSSAGQGYVMEAYLAPAPDETPEEPPAPDAPASDELMEWLGKAIDANNAVTEALEHLQMLLDGAVG